MAVKKDALPFERALERLEEIVDRLETGSVPLAEALTLFEEGIGLRRRCLELLKEAEERVKFLTTAESGEPVEGDPPAGWQEENGGGTDDVD